MLYFSNVSPSDSDATLSVWRFMDRHKMAGDANTQNSVSWISQMIYNFKYIKGRQALILK